MIPLINKLFTGKNNHPFLKRLLDNQENDFNSSLDDDYQSENSLDVLTFGEAIELLKKYEDHLESWQKLDIENKINLKKRIEILAAVSKLQNIIQQAAINSKLTNISSNINQSLQNNIYQQQILQNQTLQQQKLSNVIDSNQAINIKLIQERISTVNAVNKDIALKLVSVREKAIPDNLLQSIKDTAMLLSKKMDIKLDNGKISSSLQSSIESSKLHEKSGIDSKVIDKPSTNISKLNLDKNFNLSQQKASDNKDSYTKDNATSKNNNYNSSQENNFRTDVVKQEIDNIKENDYKSVSNIEAKPIQKQEHGAGCSCPACNPKGINLEAINKLSVKALEDVKSSVKGHGAGCSCPSCRPKNISIEPAFKEVNLVKGF